MSLRTKKSQQLKINQRLYQKTELIEAKETTIIELKEIIQNKQEWLIYFQRFHTFLANKGIKSIEGYTNYYLREFGTNLMCALEGTKLLADGKTDSIAACLTLEETMKHLRIGNSSLCQMARNGRGAMLDHHKTYWLLNHEA